jgi:predicted MFS family arabinose efflux permease
MTERLSSGLSLGRAIWVTRLVFAVNGLLFASWVSRIPAIQDDLDASERSLGFALLFTAVGLITATPFSGRLISRFGARRVLAVVVVIACLAYPALGWAPDLVALSAVLLIVGAASGIWDVAMNVAGHAVEVEARRPLMPGFHAGWSIGTVAGAGYGALAASANWSPTLQFAIASAVVGAATLMLLPTMPDRPGEPDPEDAVGEHHVPRGALIRDPRLLSLGILTFCAAWAEGAASDWLALTLNEERGASGATAALGFAVFAGAMTLGRAAGNPVVSRFGRVRTLRVGALVSVAGVAMLVLVPSLPVAFVGALLWGLGIAVAFPLAMSAAGETPGRGPSAIATVATLAYTGFLVGPPLIGTFAHEVGLADSLWVVVALALGIFALAGKARERVGGPAGEGPVVRG